MDVRTTITVLFPGNRAEVFSAVTLKELANELLQSHFKLTDRPLLLLPQGLKNNYYYNAHAFEMYALGRYSFKELEKSCWCNGLYRNKTNLVTQRNTGVEPESLWLKRGDVLHLLDADNYITCDFNVSKNLFYKIE
jgi:hypothetical protein